MYLLLDCVTLFSGEKVRINIDPMVFGFAIGSLVMASILFYQKRMIKFRKIEIITTILLIICIVVWGIFGSYLTLVISIISEIIIGTYLIIQTFKYPKVEYNLIGYLGFIIVSVISVIFTKAWTIPEVGYAISESILSFVILIPLLKKWFKERQQV